MEVFDLDTALLLLHHPLRPDTSWIILGIEATLWIEVTKLFLWAYICLDLKWLLA